jgi:hypothetical protein
MLSIHLLRCCRCTWLSSPRPPPHRFMVCFISKLILEQKKKQKEEEKNIPSRNRAHLARLPLRTRPRRRFFHRLGFRRRKTQKKKQLISQRRRRARDDEMDRSNVQSRFVLKHMYTSHSVFDMSNFLSSPPTRCDAGMWRKSARLMFLF